MNDITILLNSERLDVLTLSETWLSPENSDVILAVDNYTCYRADRQTLRSSGARKTGGGLAIYVKSNCLTDSDKYAHMNLSNEDIELQLIYAKKGGDKSTIIINSYRPPSGNCKNFNTHLSQVLDKLNGERYSDIYLLGDLNLDHTPSRKDENTKSLQHLLKGFGLTQMIKCPTRRTISSSTLIDVAYVKTSKKIYPFIITTAMSDHYLIGVTRYLGYVPDTTILVEGRSYRRYTFAQAEDYYKQIDKQHIYQLHDVNMVYQTLMSYIENCASKLCPLRQIKVRENKPVWVDHELIELLNDRDDAFLEAYTTGNPDLLKIARELKTKAKRAIRIAKSNYIKTYLENNRDDPRKFWQGINSLIKKKPVYSNMVLLDDEKKPVPENATADYINDYFSNIGINLAKQFHQTSVPNPTQEDGKNTSQVTNRTLYLSPLSENALLTEIKKINIYKSSGIHGISSRLIKDAMQIMLKEFTYLCNLSIHTGIVPDAWKIANVVPIPKIKNPDCVSDLRPISLLPLPGKILEYFIHSQLMSHLINNKILSDNQYGFRQGFSTVDAITTVLDDVGVGINNGKITLATFIDFSKAFDTLDHNILLTRLAELNLHSTSLAWFSSYLSNRKQTVIVNNTQSSERDISTGVPQGSVLGPLLFILYVNTLAAIDINSTILMYADDTIIYMAVDKTPCKTQLDRYQQDLDKVTLWCTQNKLSINTKKTKLMYLGTNKRNKNPPCSMPLKINDNMIDFVSVYKYLGLVLNPQLNLTEHIKLLIGSIAGKLNTFSYIRKYVDVRTALLIYKTTILPIFEYGNITHCLVPTRLRIKMQRFQTRALRAVFYLDNNLSPAELHFKANLLELEYRSNIQLLCLIHKRSFQNEKFPLVETDVVTRATGRIRFQMPKPNSERFKKFPMYYGVSLWNKIPPDIQKTDAYPVFKSKIKHYVRSNPTLALPVTELRE